MEGRDMTCFCIRSRAQVSSISWHGLGLLQFAVVALVLNGCSRPAQAPPAATQAPSDASEKATTKPLLSDALPAAVTAVAESAEALFDAARLSQWKAATSQLQALSDAA